jgi:uncharacterized protein
VILDISKILKSPGDSLNYSGKIDLSEDLFAANRISEISPLSVDGVVKNISGVVVLEGKGSFSYLGPCDRCGEGVRRILEFSFSEVFSKDAEESEESDALVLEGNTIDLKDIAEREAFASLPLKNLCREDCKGLCPRCGANLNFSTCECKDDEWNPQFEFLKGIKFD